MNNEQLNKANIDNLSALWKSLGSRRINAAEHAVHCSASWPNRCWSDWPTRLFAGPFLPEECIVPVWQAGAHSRLQEQALQAQGFHLSFAQQAMVLELNGRSEQRNDRDIAIINTEDDIAIWSAIASQAFGYQIDPDVILRGSQKPNLQLLLGYDQQQPAVTALLYQSEGVLGVHQLGVAPEFRGRGLANKMMAALLNSQMARDSEWMVLQASAAGEPMYRKLGFQRQFLIRNYQR